MSVELNLMRAAAIVAAGGAAGFINSIVGSGTLVSFPTLVGIGYTARIANISKCIQDGRVIIVRGLFRKPG